MICKLVGYFCDCTISSCYIKGGQKHLKMKLNYGVADKLLQLYYSFV